MLQLPSLFHPTNQYLQYCAILTNPSATYPQLQLIRSSSRILRFIVPFLGQEEVSMKNYVITWNDPRPLNSYYSAAVVTNIDFFHSMHI